MDICLPGRLESILLGETARVIQSNLRYSVLIGSCFFGFVEEFDMNVEVDYGGGG